MTATENTPALWQKRLPRPRIDGHKYNRGHVALLGSAQYTGATRLAAEACSRVGAGLVTVLTTNKIDVYQSTLPADIMVRDEAIAALNRVNCVLAGPGGCNDAQKRDVLNVGSVGLVLDADAIAIASQLTAPPEYLILTPHEGEFARAFPAIEGQRVDRALQAAAQVNGICVLKGANTIIAAPNGDCRINAHASPWLAKAGTGDVLAGLIAGLAAQGMDPFDAASAGVWMHGDIGRRIGVGLTPPDMMAVLPIVLSELYADS